MSKLTKNEESLLRLYARSNKDSDGWAVVSSAVWPLMADISEELMEREGNSTVGGRCRLTEEGKLISDWLL